MDIILRDGVTINFSAASEATRTKVLEKAVLALTDTVKSLKASEEARNEAYKKLAYLSSVLTEASKQEEDTITTIEGSAQEVPNPT